MHTITIAESMLISAQLVQDLVEIYLLGIEREDLLAFFLPLIDFPSFPDSGNKSEKVKA